MYDPGYPFLRLLIYGLCGVVVVSSTFTAGFILASRDRVASAKLETSRQASEPADDVLVVRAPPNTARFPAFAPEGVIVIQPPSEDGRAFASVESPRARSAVERASSRGPARSDARTAALTPVVVAQTEAITEEPQPQAAAAQQAIQATGNDAPPTRDREDSEQRERFAQSDGRRSWYRSPEYYREVAERRRAEREEGRRQAW